MNAVIERPSSVVDFPADKVELVKRTICKDSTDDELQLFLYQCKRTGLDPFARQIYSVPRWDRKLSRYTHQTQVSIDGFRLIAERSGKYAGQLGPWWTADGKEWTDCWISKDPPKAARVGVLRSDFKEPLFAVAIWESYRQTDKEGNTTQFWRKMPELMLAKVAEALAMRKAFPMELSGIYTPEEMAQAENPEPQGITVNPRGDLGKGEDPLVYMGLADRMRAALSDPDDDQDRICAKVLDLHDELRIHHDRYVGASDCLTAKERGIWKKYVKLAQDKDRAELPVMR